MEYALLFVLGTALGSFLNVVALRYDPDQFLLSTSQIGGRSRCMHCKRTLRWFELVPLLSFLAQRGRCRRCKHALSLRYPVVELLAGAILLFVPWKVATIFVALSPALLIALTMMWVLVFLTLLLLALIDLRLMLIPDETNIFLFVLGIGIVLLGTYAHLGVSELSSLKEYSLLLGFSQNLWANRIFAALFGLCFFGFLVVATRGRGMGMGDVKLAFALGMIFGWPDILALIMIAFVLGAVVGVFLMFRGDASMKSSIPFGPFLVLGSVLIFLCGEAMLHSYFQLFNY